MRTLNRHRSHERGIALMMALLALMVLSAIAVGMMFMSGTETSISSNFKSEETAYFSARAGVEEVRDRMLTTNTNTISALLPTTLPTSTGGVLYILQSGVAASTITNMSSSNTMADDELCHDFPYGGVGYGGMTPVPANVRCTTVPAGNGWYQTTASIAPFPLDYKWVRVTLKANNSSPYTVDSTQPVSNQVCWNGSSEVVLPTGTAACPNMTPPALPVFLVTSLAVTSSGARRIVQQEIAQTPSGSLPGGLFSTGNGCSSLNIAGNAHTGSFNSSTETTPSNPPTNLTNTNGNVGSNGNISLGGSSTSVNGSIGTNLSPTIGSCPGSGVSVAGSPGMGTVFNFPTPYMPPVPPLPNPLPPVTSATYKNTTLTPGAYGNVTFKGTVTLTGGSDINHPAVYTMNSLTLNGNANLVINGPVVINLAGVGQTTVLDMTGGSFSNTTNLPNDFVINYGGTGNLTMTGGNDAYAVINAPRANISFHGGSNFYGQAIGQTIDDQGGTNFYWDQAGITPPAPTASYYEISLRELSY
jgi:hypothetical protein